MYPIPSTEKLVETKTCHHCQASFPITDKDLEFYDKVSPTFGGKKYQIPTPTLCPDCRQQRRLSFRNERKLYKRNCDATGKSIISIYSPDKPYKVYHRDFWWSDGWDAIQYGKELDFSKKLSEQLWELQLLVPRLSIVSLNAENSEYLSQGANNKNCYMCFTTSNSEDCFYSNFSLASKNSFDCSVNVRGEGDFSCVNITDCTRLFYSTNCNSCSYSYYLRNCNGCSFCFGCSNLINKTHYIFNKPCTAEEYNERLPELLRLGMDVDTPEWIERNSHNYHNEDVIGDAITNSKNCCYCFNGFDIGDCKYCFDIGDQFDSMDCNSLGLKSSLDYEVISGEQTIQTLFSVMPFEDREILYCDNCFFSSHLFWCIGLRNKQYCILNKQYTREEYETLVPKIISHMMKTGEWWEFFPSNLSPFWYNETVAQEYYPLTKEQVTKDDIFNWSDYEPPFPKVEKIIPASKLLQDIKDVPDDILNWAIECEVTRKPFRIIKQELEFYRKHNLPIPKRHPDQRHLDRMAQRNPRKLFERKCDCCHKDMITTYAPERPERVYCEECYNREVIG